MNEGIVFWLIIGIISVLGVLVVLVPIIGLTARFALKPMMESIAGFRDAQGQVKAFELLERRLALVEERMDSAERTLESAVEGAEFHRELGASRLETSAEER